MGDSKTEPGFVYEDPNFKVKKSPLERRMLWKADILIVSLTSLVFIVNQWDRSNIGNARVMGFQTDLHISSSDFYDAVSLYYVGYALCILPANLLVRILRADRQIGGCVIIFATLSCCMAAAKNAGGVLALRIIFGFASAFLQGLGLYTSMWYKRNELATRTGIFYSASTIAGGFSGLIAYAVQKNLDGKDGRPAWQWLFIIQGVAGVFVGLCCWFLLPPPPDQIKGKKHWIFTPEEIDVAITRAKTYNVEGAGFNWRQMWIAFKDPKTTMFCLVNAGIAIGLASISAFLPSFISQFGYSTVQTQLFSVIPYACAFVTLIAVNYLSDRFNVKGVVIMGCFATSITGYVILMAVHDHRVKLFATCLITMGVFPGVTLQGAWVNINVGGYTKRATTYGTTEIIAQCFSILASHIYTDPPQYIKGHSIVMSFQILAFLATGIAMWWMRCENRRKDEEARTRAETGAVHENEYKTLEEVFDYHPSFRYVL
ncbi:Major facilitator superfamily domain, general substrate transporter [Niveomyces insectorum RCEF 264]|uniref:Major facilitator superfamily domain, general substrate transporter n=1 Tax=Niveomyces insectorum RCEF 264 TaxID=1081102 RepID=A0A167T8E0_9HYPO|nr:Major facilitator superfamily domain, general substrate transporter [Niveomyces insectorum RCEF 264]